jgi:hypothetical protein
MEKARESSKSSHKTKHPSDVFSPPKKRPRLPSFVDGPEAHTLQRAAIVVVIIVLLPVA